MENDLKTENQKSIYILYLKLFGTNINIQKPKI